MNDVAVMGRILVAEDDPMWRDLLKHVLSALRYEIVAVSDGEAAWVELQSGRAVDIVITDRNMPKLDGMELMARVRADSALRHIPVIFQSAMDKEHEVLEGLAAGVFHYLEKPYSLDLMRTVVAAALAESRSRKGLAAEVQRQRQALALLRHGSFVCRTLNEARELAVLLASVCPDPEAAVNGLSELLINAVEHGNLGVTYEEKGRLLAEGRWLEELERRQRQPGNCRKRVTAEMERDEDKVVFRIEDEGAGFDWRRYLEIDPARATHPHGRGIAMARLLSFSALEYQGAGNRVVAIIDLPPPG
jgi:CheY-like chemotaxis protein/anti-sigma regulatory factor (Ser/Thr protein kinase)